MNLARRRITERFMLECDEIFVICNIGRAVTDAGVESVLKLAHKAQLSNVGIICTRSDDIQADEAKKDWKGQKSQNIQRLSDAVAADKRDDANIEAEIDDFEEFDDLSDDEKQEVGKLQARQRLIRKRRDGHEFELQAYLITTRNRIIKRKLQLQYSSKVPTGEVRVFCVSNKNYWDHRENPREAALPYLHLSGILEVRKYCISIVANSQRRIASRYMNHNIPDLYAQIQLWVQSGAGSADAERKEVVRHTLNRLETRLKKDLSSRTSSVNQVAKAMKEDFAEQVYENRQISEWSEAAVEAGYQWSGWHHSSYAAFCRRYGDYCTPAAGKHNWNEEAIEKMVQDLKIPWEALCSCVENREVKAGELLEDLTDWSTQLLEDDLGIPEIADPLVDALESQRQVLAGSIEQIYEEFGASSKTLRTDVMSGIQTSLIGQAMQGAYRSCNLESGRGSDARRKGIINAALAHDDLFRGLMKDFKKSFHLLADEAQEKIRIAVASYLSSIHSTLDIILSDNVALESEQDPAFRRRVDEDAKAGKEAIDKTRAEIQG
ncbi:hypothetical protein QQZ08_009478 [Neonectria magnoliae]|uniref:DUF7605 domain-containing protein n=1 Tax=Neonectria magnoliae TaxID=2732573 RepID=A0ABR1HMP7_9HYPO